MEIPLRNSLFTLRLCVTTRAFRAENTRLVHALRGVEFFLRKTSKFAPIRWLQGSVNANFEPRLGSPKSSYYTGLIHFGARTSASPGPPGRVIPDLPQNRGSELGRERLRTIIMRKTWTMQVVSIEDCFVQAGSARKFIGGSFLPRGNHREFDGRWFQS